MSFIAPDPQFAERVRSTFGRQRVMALIHEMHCATLLQALMTMLGKADS